MRFDEWKPLYEEIVKDFGFDAAQDIASAGALASALSGPGYRPISVWLELEKRFRGRPVLVLGAGDDAAARAAAAPKDVPLVAADGATSAALEAHRIPDLIVTDLDGHVPHEVEAARQGSRVAIHAHGDNQAAVQRWLGAFPPENVVGTCQCRPMLPLRNYGGFTDGDRSCFIAAGLGAKSLRLLGFDFSGRIGRYTGGHDPLKKARKLEWARRLLHHLEARGVNVEYA